jgi:hypothetical protein
MAQLPPILQQETELPSEFQPIFKKPSAPPEEVGYVQTYIDQFIMNPMAQMAASHQDYLRPRTTAPQYDDLNAMNVRGRAALALTNEPIPDDPSFDLESWLRQDPNRIRYAHVFQDVYSEAAATNVWNHLKDAVERRDRLARSEHWTAKLLGGLSTPDVALPIGGIKTGVGFVNGVLRGAAVGLPYTAANEAISLKYDPTATIDDAKQHILYGTALMGLMGGGFGAVGRTKSAAELSRSMIDEGRRIVGETADGLDEPLTRSVAQTEGIGFSPYIARPTGDIPTGFASAGGFERIASRQSGWARVANSGVRAYEDLANRFFGDGGVMFERNRQGIATEPSAFLAGEAWMAKAGDAILDIKNLHANYLTDGLESINIAGLNVRSSLASIGDKVRKVTNRPRMDGKLRTDEFEKEVFDTYINAQITGLIDHPIPQIKEAALRIQKFFKEFFDEGIKTNYFKGPEHLKYLDRIKNEYDSIEGEIANLIDIERTSVQDAILNRLQTYRDSLKKELYLPLRKEKLILKIKEKNDKIADFKKDPRGMTKAQLEFEQKLIKEKDGLLNSLKKIDDEINDFANRKPLQFYFPHRWDRGAVVRNEEKLREILTKHFENSARSLGYILNDEAIAARVSSTIDNILGRVDDEAEEIIPATLSGDGRAFFTRARKLDIPTPLITDFIDTDLLGVMREYARKAGLGLEYTRAFDTPTGELAINRASIQAAREGKPLSEISKHEDDIRTVRDILLSRNSSYETIGTREASILRSFFTLTSMGKAIFSNLAEIARVPWVLGIQETMGYALNALGNKDLIRGMNAELRANTVSKFEVTLGMVQRHLIENGPDTFGSISKYNRAVSKVEKPLAYFASVPYHIANGVAIFTYFIKNYTGLVASEILAKRIFAVAEGTATKKDLEFLASYSIGREDAIQIAKQPFQRDRGLIYTNSTQWTDRNSIVKFFSAVDSIQKRVITTPTAADKPNVMMGVLGSGATKVESQMLALPFQLKAWSFAANNKILLSALQGRDANVMAGALGMFGMAYMMNMIKIPDYAWNKMTETEKLLMAFESSGIAAFYGDLNFMAETASQDTIGIRPMLGMKPKFGQGADAYDVAGEFTGPAISKMIDIYKAFNGGVPRDKARVTVNSIPLNNLFWIPESFRAMARKRLEEAYR